MDYRDERALHILSGFSGIRLMRQAFGLSVAQFITNQDPLSIGPARYSSDREAWRQLRDDYLENYLGYGGRDTLPSEFGENWFLESLERLGEEYRLFVWAAAGVSEQLNVAFVLQWMKQIGKNNSRVLLVPVDFDFALGKVAGILNWRMKTYLRR